jgi:hypothetical protein
MEER